VSAKSRQGEVMTSKPSSERQMLFLHKSPREGPLHPVRQVSVPRRFGVYSKRQSRRRGQVQATGRERPQETAALPRLRSSPARVPRTPLSRSSGRAVPILLPNRGKDCVGRSCLARRADTKETNEMMWRPRHGRTRPDITRNCAGFKWVSEGSAVNGPLFDTAVPGRLSPRVGAAGRLRSGR
jgi:hypothetical protein